jgi:hypothetical protein
MQIVNKLLVAGDSSGCINWFTRDGQLIFSRSG